MNNIEIKDNKYIDDGVILLPIPELNYNPNYLANTKIGKVYSVKSERYLDPKPNKRFKYRYTTILKKPYSVANLIMSAHAGVKKEWWRKQRLEINHLKPKEEEGSDAIEFLELVTRKQQYDKKHDPTIIERMSNKRRLTKDEVITIKTDWLTTDKDEHKAKPNFCNKWSGELGCSYSCIEDILNGKTWANIKVA